MTIAIITDVRISCTLSSFALVAVVIWVRGDDIKRDAPRLPSVGTMSTAGSYAGV